MASFDPTTHIQTATVVVTGTSSSLQTLGPLTQAEIEDADIAVITPASDVWWLPGAKTVTSSLYHIASGNKVLTISGYRNVRDLRLLRAGGANVNVTVSLYKVNRDNVDL
jgi:hypothetical protein